MTGDVVIHPAQSPMLPLPGEELTVSYRQFSPRFVEAMQPYGFDQRWIDDWESVVTDEIEEAIAPYICNRHCIDCHVDIYEIDEYYMVYDHVWHAAGMGRYIDDGMLCLDCLSRRLGRRLYLDDFTPLPMNRKEHTAHSILWAVRAGADQVTAGDASRRAPAR
jgi:hypothetical protein